MAEEVAKLEVPLTSSRSASNPASYAARATPVTATASRPEAAAAQPGSPAAPGPDRPRTKQTRQPPNTTGRHAGRQGGGSARASPSCAATSSTDDSGQTATDAYWPDAAEPAGRSTARRTTRLETAAASAS
jgi:hypothetical protein